MTTAPEKNSRVHDLLAAVLGGVAALLLATSPWNVDTEGPDPFYKGPLIFPLIVLSMMTLAAIPAWGRLLRPPQDSTWRLDGRGLPVKTAVVLGLLIAALMGLVVIGLEASCAGFLVVALYYLGRRGWVQLVVMPVVVTLLIVVVFKYLLDIFFPTPLIIDWMGG